MLALLKLTEYTNIDQQANLRLDDFRFTNEL